MTLSPLSNKGNTPLYLVISQAAIGVGGSCSAFGLFIGKFTAMITLNFKVKPQC